MKNFRLQPFEKNNYFYGKLLTVRDFQTEQKYNDEKRWMINRLMFGSGIAAGLKTVMIDEQTISIQPGVAIDNLGREIVIASPITQKLSLIDGFDNSGYAKNVYLCINYDDKGKEKIQSITNSSELEDDEISSYNRIQDSFNIFLKEDVSSNFINKKSTLVFSKLCIYEDKAVKIIQSIPKYLEANEEFDIDIEIEKKDAASKIRLSYQLVSKNIINPLNKNNSINIEFNESKEENKDLYRLTYKLKAVDKIESNAVLNITSIKVSTAEGKLDVIDNKYQKFSIVENKIESILENFGNKSIDEIVNDDGFDTIYLAKIELLKVGITYLIKSIENGPFNQYVYNSSILAEILKNRLIISDDNLENKLSNENNKVAKDKSLAISTKNEVVKKESKAENIKDSVTSKENIKELNKINISTGQYTFKYNYKTKYPNTMTSEHISHGLGEGNVFVNTALVVDDYFEDIIVSGDVDILEGDSKTKTLNLNDCKLAVMVYPKSGTFTITVKTEKSFTNDILRVNWMAVKK